MDNGIGTPEAVGVITATQLVLIVVLVLLVALGIWWGTKNRRTQRRAEEEARQRREMAPPPPPVEEEQQVARAEPPVAPPPLANDEPIPASAPLEANPAAQAADEQVVPPVAAEPGPDASPRPAAGAAETFADAPVTLIKGLGPKVAERLAEKGITRVGQLAALSDAEASALDARLGNFTGRMARDRWLDQARLLAAGDRAGFEATFGKLG